MAEPSIKQNCTLKKEQTLVRKVSDILYSCRKKESNVKLRVCMEVITSSVQVFGYVAKPFSKFLIVMGTDREIYLF